MKQDEKKDLRLIKKNQGTTPVAVHTHNPWAETLKALEGNEDPELENKINDIIKIMKQYGTIVTPERPDWVTLLPKDLWKTELKTHILCINYDIKNNVFTITQNFYNGPNKDRRPPYEEVKKDGKPVMIYSEETKKMK